MVSFLVPLGNFFRTHQEIFHKINRPSSQLRLDGIIEGLIRFRKEYSGKIWLEVFIIPGINDTKAELNILKKVIGKIKADQVHLNTLDRPGSVSTLRAATREELEHVLDVFQMDNATIVADPPKHKMLFSYRKDTADAILGTIARRPCTSKDLSEILGLQVEEVEIHLKSLETGKKIRIVKQKRGFFYQLK